MADLSDEDIAEVESAIAGCVINMGPVPLYRVTALIAEARRLRLSDADRDALRFARGIVDRLRSLLLNWADPIPTQHVQALAVLDRLLGSGQ